jgi:serine/threonine protein kinase
LLKEIGHGSYGNVWLARGVTGVYRAVKIVWRARFGDSEPYEREFRGLKEFVEVSGNGGALLSVLHVGRNDAAGFFYYVMELADDLTTGRQIDPERYVPKTLDQIRRQAGRLAAGPALDLGVALANALASLHDRGLVHRDVKPSNIIFVGNVPKFADIGLVRSAMAAEDCPSVVGNTAYMPNDVPGRPSADVFGLGKVLYELSTGRCHKDFPCLPNDLETVPDRKALLELNKIVLRACALNPAERFPNARALLEEMQELQAGKPIRPVRTTERQFVWLRAAAALVIASLVASLGTWILSRPETIEGRHFSARLWDAGTTESANQVRP